MVNEIKQVKIDSTNYDIVAKKATQDGSGNVITNTYATKKDVGDTTALETEYKQVVGAINELNDKSIDKIGDLYPATGGVEHVSKTEYGIQFDNTYELFLKDETSADGVASEPYSSMYHTINVPIVAGENVEFEVDEKNKVVKINATGGEIDTSKFVSKYTISASPSTTVASVITAITEAGGSVGDWNVVVFTGYITATVGVQMSWYGGTGYTIKGINLTTGGAISYGTNAWDDITIDSFLEMFKSPIPPCDSTNEGQFLRVVSGAPAWVAVPNAEEASF